MPDLPDHKSATPAVPAAPRATDHMRDSFPVAQAVVHTDGTLVSRNVFFDRLFMIGTDDPSPGSLDELLGDAREAFRLFLEQPSPQGLDLDIPQGGRERHVRVLCNRLTDEGSDLCFLVFHDLSNYKDSVNYFEHSFDNFMRATIDLEEALRIIEEQKQRIESMHKELQITAETARKDMDLAVILQDALLPSIPQDPTWDIDFFYKPMAGVSGDIYDFYSFSDTNYLGMVLLDASGHGVSSSLITAIARPIFFRAHRRLRHKPLRGAMTAANEELCTQIGSVSNYLTGVSIRLAGDHFKYINAGHPYILYYRAANGRTYELENDGVLLGIPEFSPDFVTRKVFCGPGDVLLLYTDGLTEAENAAGEEYGSERLAELVREVGGPPTALCRAILDDVQSFGIDMNRLADDLTFFVLQRSPA